MPEVRILLVDDVKKWRQLIRSILRGRPELHVVGEASDGLEAVGKAQELEPDLILLDIGLPNLNGIEAARRISRMLPDAKILFVSQNNDPDVVAAALSDGARGYVYKVEVRKELLPAVEAILLGKHFIPAGIRPGTDKSLRSN
jgi:DNA-binding NarL/FixJ family response regulator